MRKAYKKIAAVLLCAALLICAVSCGKNKDEGTYEISGLFVSEIQVVHLENEDYNFILSVKNPYSEPAQFDIGKFELLLNGTDIIPHFGGMTECKAGKTEKFSFMIDYVRPKMSVGDSVTVKFGDRELCKIKITEL